jgi:pimeloyl-ACP methyl ester carboxylesterase
MPRRNPKGNNDGECERLGGIVATHRFIDAPGALVPIRWHFVEAGEGAGETILFLHGNPESWHSWHSQIERFAPRYHVVAPDLKGYGQGDKRPGDWRWENCAEEMLALLDKLNLRRFHIVAHDRGCVLADYLGGNHPERVLSYTRMQQVCHIWVASNSPQGGYFADPIFGPYIFGDPDFYFQFRLLKMLKNPVPQARLERFKEEMSHPGLADAVVRYFQSSSFEKERLDRTSRLLRKMSFPVQLLQGDLDEGQPPYYYDHPDSPAAAQFPNARLVWIHGAGHYTNLEKPEVVSNCIETFVKEVARSSG